MIKKKCHACSFVLISFELSVPGRALLATPDFGVVSPLSSLAVSVGVNKAAFERDANKRNGIVLPWTGSLYVNGDDGATVAVKVKRKIGVLVGFGKFICKTLWMKRILHMS